MGGIYVIQNDLEKADFFLRKALEINPTLRKLYFNLAQVQEKKGNRLEAIDFYKKELENYPEAFKSAYNLAEELRKSGKYAEAVPFYRQSIEHNPSFNIPYFMVAKYLFDSRSDIDGAIELCNEGIQLKIRNKYTVFGYYILADIYSYKEDQEKSRSYLAKAETLKQKLIKNGVWNTASSSPD
jgi:tetratricopeptide (TPR) repeat protein